MTTQIDSHIKKYYLVLTHKRISSFEIASIENKSTIELESPVEPTHRLESRKRREN